MENQLILCNNIYAIKSEQQYLQFLTIKKSRNYFRQICDILVLVINKTYSGIWKQVLCDKPSSRKYKDYAYEIC